MPNRNRNSSIWKDSFYRSLPPLYKCLWDYINDDCDNAGVWIPDFKVASICIGKRVKPEIAQQFFGSKIQVLQNGNWLLPAFIQERLCFTELKTTDRFQKSIIELLNKHNLILNKGLVSPLQGAIINTYTEVDEEVKEEKGVQGEKQPPLEIGTPNGHRVTIRTKYVGELPKVVHNLESFFDYTGQLPDIRAAGWTDFTGFMKANPGAIFDDDDHLYHSFKKYSTKPKELKSTFNRAELFK